MAKVGMNYKDVRNECHPRDDPNCDEAEHIFAHHVDWVKPKGDGYGGDACGGTYICCFTGKVCKEWQYNFGSISTEFCDCRICAVPNYEMFHPKRNKLLISIGEAATKDAKTGGK